MTLLIAQAVGIRSGAGTLQANINRVVPWRFVTFDTKGRSGIIVTYPDGTPSGNIYCSVSGYWRISGQIYALPPAQYFVSLYIGLYDLGVDGLLHNGPIYSANQFLPVGEHPSLRFGFELKVSAPRYYAIECYYLTATGNPQTHSLVEGDNYNSLFVEFLGGP